METIITIWRECVISVWLAASGPVLGYHTELDGVRGLDVTSQYELCLLQIGVEVSFRVQGFGEDGNVGPWSVPERFRRVHNFHIADVGQPMGIGTVGWGDFSSFITSFNTVNHPDGTVTGGGP